MKMTDSPVVSKVLDGNVYVGIPPSQKSAIFGSSPSLLVPKSKNATTVSPSKSFVSYFRIDGLITFASGVVLGVIGSVINLGLAIVSVLLAGLIGHLMTGLLYSMLFYTFVNLSGHVILWALSKQWHPSALRDRLVVVPSENLGQLGLRLGLGFGLDLLGMQVLIGIRYGLSAGNVVWLVLFPFVNLSGHIIVWAFFKQWQSSALRDRYLGQLGLGLGFGLLGMQVLTGIRCGLSAGNVAWLVLFLTALLLSTQLQYRNSRAMERSNNSQHSGNIEHTDSFLYAQIV